MAGKRGRMTRYIYTDPLAAVWMAKHFGMKFSYSRNHGKSNGEGSSPDIRKGLLYPSPFCNTDGLATCKTSRGGELIGSDRLFAYGDLQVHPDSLLLLEPQVGDMLTNIGVIGWKLSGIERGRLQFYDGNGGPVTYGRKEEMTIIQRNGKAFMWPESESEAA
jgi:hypothetical protein